MQRSERDDEIVYRNHSPSSQSRHFEENKPNKRPSVNSVLKRMPEVPVVLSTRELPSVSANDRRNVEELVTTKQTIHPDRAVKAAFIEMKKDGEEGESFMATVALRNDNAIAAVNVEEGSYELVRSFCMEVQVTHRTFSNQDTYPALDLNIHAILANPTPTCACDKVNTQATRRAVFVEVDDPL